MFYCILNKMNKMCAFRPIGNLFYREMDKNLHGPLQSTQSYKDRIDQ